MKGETENKSGWGGARPGAGRRKGSGRYGEPTKVIRVPASKVAQVRAFLDRLYAHGTVAPQARAHPRPVPAAFPFYAASVAAGFPSPAEDYEEPALDLNDYLVQHREATFFVRAQGHSMVGAGIHDGDLLVVDRALTARDGDIVIAVVDGALTVKRLRQQGERTWLQAENPDYGDIELGEAQQLELWGVVTAVIHQYR
ncbi:MAG TPA: translesion error-prone DNA polymerase V autoproteolytic subunit [Sulfurivirga caldicuralii]|nr:translesion error-prone DNA polymerase V autoproteolytic subunit [Sulfurivirga caldicuralii]